MQEANKTYVQEASMQEIQQISAASRRRHSTCQTPKQQAKTVSDLVARQQDCCPTCGQGRNLTEQANERILELMEELRVLREFRDQHMMQKKPNTPQQAGGALQPHSLAVTAVRDGTTVMQKAGVDSRVIDVTGSSHDNWMPEKGITYGASVTFAGDEEERFAMVFAKVNPATQSYKSDDGETISSFNWTCEIMLLANNPLMPNATQEQWNEPDVVITLLLPLARPTPATHSKVIEQDGYADNFSYVEDRPIQFDLTDNQSLLEQKIGCDLANLKPAFEKDFGYDTSDMSYFSC